MKLIKRPVVYLDYDAGDLFYTRRVGAWGKCNITPNRFFSRKSKKLKTAPSFSYIYKFRSYIIPVMACFIFTKYNTVQFKRILSRLFGFANPCANQLEKYLLTKPIYKCLNINPIEQYKYAILSSFSTHSQLSV